MSSPCPERRRAATALLWLLALAAGHVAADTAAPLRVCADPDNPPYSQRDERGFENRIARLLADDLRRPLHYTWLRDRRGFVRKTIGAGLCDLVVGVPAGFAALQTTAPYYRSAFYFVERTDGPGLSRFTDPRLPLLRIGVQLVGIDPGTSPVGYALARHGAVERVRGFTLTEAETTPTQRMVDAVAAGRLDTALVWGPQAGGFVATAPVPLRLLRARVPPDMATLPFEFDIAMGVRRGDDALQHTLDDFLRRRRGDIDALLAAHHVPRTDRPEATP
jgi:mxaJ protein